MGVMKSTESYVLSKLSNGLELLYIPMPQAKSVFISLTGKVGRRVELDSEVGAAHFLEHLFFDGTKKRPSALEISLFIEEAGAARNATTSSEIVDYFVKIIPENATAGFDFLSDIFQNSLLEEIEKERKVIAQEAVTNRDDPFRTLVRNQISTLYPGQSFGRTIFDEEANLPNINKKVLQEYLKRTYVADNFLLCVAGNIGRKEAEKLSEEYFASISNGQEVVPEPVKFNKQKTIDIQNKDVKQSKLAIGFEAYPLNHKMSMAASLLSVIAGGGQSSRLYDRLRNKSHAVYSVFSRNRQSSDTGCFLIFTFMNEENLQRACDEIVEELRRLLKEGIREGELRKAKNILLSSLLFSSENVVNLADSYTNQYLLSGKIKAVEQKTREIEQVTESEVLEAAKAIFSDQPKVNVITPTAKSLEFGRIS